MKKLVYILAIALTFISCSTTKGFSGKADFCGLITDSNNQGVAGYSVCINGLQKAVTNDSGIFLVSGIKSGIVKITGNSPGYENIETETFFSDENSFFCMQIKSEKEIFEEVERFLENEDFEKTSSLLNSFTPTDESKKIIPLYESILFFKKGNFSKSRELLSELKLRESESLSLYKKEIEKQIKEKKQHEKQMLSEWNDNNFKLFNMLLFRK